MVEKERESGQKTRERLVMMKRGRGTAITGGKRSKGKGMRKGRMRGPGKARRLSRVAMKTKIHWNLKVEL